MPLSQHLSHLDMQHRGKAQNNHDMVICALQFTEAALVQQALQALALEHWSNNKGFRVSDTRRCKEESPCDAGRLIASLQKSKGCCEKKSARVFRLRSMQGLLRSAPIASHDSVRPVFSQLHHKAPLLLHALPWLWHGDSATSRSCNLCSNRQEPSFKEIPVPTV